MSHQPLTGRNALVLGVERPAGRRAAVALAEAGANVAVVTLSADTKAEFAANSTANEFWALGRKGVALTSDASEPTVAKSIADATAELGPISILIWHAPDPLPRTALTALRSDPAIVVLVGLAGDDAPPDETRALLEWTRELANAGLRANAIATQVITDAADAVLKQHQPPDASDLASAVVYLASDASAAIEGAIVLIDP